MRQRDIKDSKGKNIADLGLFQTVQPISNNQTENVMINILVPLSDRKNIENIKVIAKDKGEFKSKEVNAAQLLNKSSGSTVKFAFNFDRKTDIGQIQTGDIYFACVSANELLEGLTNNGKKVLDKCLFQAKEAGATIKTQLQKGDPASIILDVSSGGKYDLIIMGSRGLGAFKRLVLGSVSSKVVHHASCSILVVRE